MRFQLPLTQRSTPRIVLAPSLLFALTLAAGLTGCGEAGEVEPWEGTLQEGVLAMADEAEGGRIEEALAIADQMLSPGATARFRERLNGATRGVSESVLSPITSGLDLLGVSALRPTDRAEIEYARAATLLAGAAKGGEETPGFLERAESALERARGAAPGNVRKSAVYNQGTLDLMTAEAARATIPEIAGTGGAGPTSPPDPNQAGADDAPDPLDIARTFYLRARDHFVEYLTQDEGEDAAANVELVIRRLRELDEIEKQREEQSQDQEQSEDGEEGEQDKEEPNEDEQENEDQQKSDEEQQSEDEQESEEQGEQEDSENESEEEPEEDPQGDSEEEPEEEPDEEDGEESDSEEQPEPGEEQIEETTMTAEELQRLLEQNKEHQERGEEIRRLRRIRGKIPAKKDW